MSFTLITLLLIFTTTRTGTMISPENLIAALKSKNITLITKKQSFTLITLLLIFTATSTGTMISPENLIAALKSKNIISFSAASAWFSSHVTPFLPHVRISAISLGYNVTDPYLLKLLPPGIDNVKEKVKELGIEGVNVLTTVSLEFVRTDSVARGFLRGLSKKNAALFVNVKPWKNVSFKKVFCGGFALKRDLSSDVSYESLDNGEMMDYGVVEVRVSKAEEYVVIKKDDKDNTMLFLLIACIIWNFIYALLIVG
ncbi:hypothetical protein CTI12_AA056880 [Artemisia annua]|uniref:Uncharacterized protein n=1 Tax=Artemisia annua TaxID=35608 RepID=A0A2U1Q9Q5_ARTAN|nr:hypothetical protein CTI12_AA056880 [Artemisia annua]